MVSEGMGKRAGVYFIRGLGSRVAVEVVDVVCRDSRVGLLKRSSHGERGDEREMHMRGGGWPFRIFHICMVVWCGVVVQRSGGVVMSVVALLCCHLRA